jgi:DNA gyrase subunit A
VRLAPLAVEMLNDIDKDTVDFGRTTTARPSRSRPSCRRGFPNLLVNGSLGIAVGMATNIPPHNLREVAAAADGALENTRRAGARSGRGAASAS